MSQSDDLLDGIRRRIRAGDPEGVLPHDMVRSWNRRDLRGVWATHRG